MTWPQPNSSSFLLTLPRPTRNSQCTAPHPRALCSPTPQRHDRAWLGQRAAFSPFHPVPPSLPSQAKSKGESTLAHVSATFRTQLCHHFLQTASSDDVRQDLGPFLRSSHNILTVFTPP